MTSHHSSDRVLVLAPVAGDGPAVATLLREQGFVAEVCLSLTDVCAQMVAGAGALLLAEEGLELAQTSDFFDQLKAQPPWSELPLIILTHAGESRLARLLDLAADAAGSITLLERPISAVTLLRSIEVALRSRRRQYQVRRLLYSLEESEQRYRATFENAAIGVSHVALDGHWLRFNDALCQITGYTREELSTKTFMDITHPDDVEADWRQARRLLAGEISSYTMDKRYIRKNGDIVWIRLTVALMRDAGGEPLNAIATTEDIDERKRNEQQLAEKARLLDLSNDAIIVRDWDGCILYWNHGADKLYGWKREEAQGKNIHAFLQTQFPQPLQEINAELSRTGEWTGELVHSTRDGRRITVLCRKVLDRDAQGNPAAVLETNTDITERKQNERRIREQEEKLHRLEKVAATGQLAAALAHEINNPLASVTNCLYLLKTNRDLTHEAQTLATTAASELERVSRIVKQSLSYYRPDTVPEKLDLSAITEESLEVFSDKFRRTGIEVTKKLTPNAQIIGFGAEVRQVIDNLLLNALEASSSRGRVVVSVRLSRDWRDGTRGVRLTIGDTGSGIAKENLSRIFEPFVTTKPDKGTGLGLWVVRGIVAKHGGNIRIRSSIGSGKSGTVISILWPALGQQSYTKDKSSSAA